MAELQAGALPALAGARGRSADAAIVGAVFLSGWAALGYQLVWTRQSTVWLGHETAAVLAVIAAFFAGLGFGGLALGPRIERSGAPARWFAACELLIGLWSVVLAAAIEPAAQALMRLAGPEAAAVRQWSIAFAGTLVLLAPATIAMGATLPAIERLLARSRGTSAIAAAYAVNTFGAVAGVLATGFWLLPELGSLGTARSCAAMNVASALLVLWSAPRPGAPPTPATSRPGAPPQIFLMLALTGLFGIGYEVLVVRALSQLTENTVFTFTIVLAVYLAGTAAGAAVYQRRPLGDRHTLLRALAVACLIGGAALWMAPDLQTWMRLRLGESMVAALVAEGLVAVLAFLPPTMLMGALFSRLASDARAAGADFGRALGANTLGGALAPIVFGVVLIDAVGTRLALVALVFGYVALSAKGGRIAWPGAATAAVALAAAVWAPSLIRVDVPPGGRIVSLREGPAATVSVVEHASSVRRLHINNRDQEGSSATRIADARQGLIPALLHPSPARAVFLGLGTGMTAGAAAADAALVIDVVELLPEVIEAQTHFATMAGTRAPNLRIVQADARRYMRTAHERFDLVVADNFHPARSGSASLYTVEHFAAIRARLADDGLFVQWLPLHQIDLGTLRTITASFLKVFPDGWALLASHSLDTPVVGLVGRPDGARLDARQLRDRLASAPMQSLIAEVGLRDELAVLGSFIAGPRSLAAFAGDAALNTDDRPLVAYRAPRLTYSPDSLPRDRLVDLLRRVQIESRELIASEADGALGARLESYWRARTRYIEIGRNVRPTQDVERMLAQVRDPLLDVLGTSPELRSAYDPLVRMAVALAPRDPRAARGLLQELAHLQPAWPEAAAALRELESRNSR